MMCLDEYNCIVRLISGHVYNYRFNEGTPYFSNQMCVVVGVGRMRTVQWPVGGGQFPDTNEDMLKGWAV